MHTTCGSPNYVAPEILLNRGYDGATSDTWSCGVILYVILTGYLPFDDRNLAVLYQKVKRILSAKLGCLCCYFLPHPVLENLQYLTLNTFPNCEYQIFKGDVQIPKWLSSGAKDLIKRILDPNPRTRITMSEIKEHKWFKQSYTPAEPTEEEEQDESACSDDDVSSVHEAVCPKIIIFLSFYLQIIYHLQFCNEANSNMSISCLAHGC